MSTPSTLAQDVSTIKGNIDTSRSLVDAIDMSDVPVEETHARRHERQKLVSAPEAPSRKADSEVRCARVRAADRAGGNLANRVGGSTARTCGRSCAHCPTRLSRSTATVHAYAADRAHIRYENNSHLSHWRVRGRLMLLPVHETAARSPQVGSAIETLNIPAC